MTQEAAEFIEARIRELGDWRGETLAAIRRIVHEAEPEIVEEIKWRGTPVWSRGGIVCTGETYKSVVKMTFAKGAALRDPAGAVQFEYGRGTFGGRSTFAKGSS